MMRAPKGKGGPRKQFHSRYSLRCTPELLEEIQVRGSGWVRDVLIRAAAERPSLTAEVCGTCEGSGVANSRKSICKCCSGTGFKPQ